MEYRNFETSIFCTQHDIESVSDIDVFAEKIKKIQRYMHIDKLYLETIRGEQLVDDLKIREVKAYCKSVWIKTSGAITLNADNPKVFKSFCYSDPKYLSKLDYVIKFTAELFDEIILDDFYFTNCRCQKCIAAKGNRTWAEFRLEQLRSVSKRIMKIAKETNPNSNIIIKYPNWYDEHRTTGYDLVEAPHIFDSVYTGTEVRVPKYTQQSLQPYLSYFLMRYLDNVSGGKNLGGWFDSIDCLGNPNVFLHQLNLTLFAKAKEATIFRFGRLSGGDDIFAPVAGYGYEKADKILSHLGSPVGLSCYRPANSRGENYLHNFLGMLGIPLEPTDKFNTSQDKILLTAGASWDNELIEKIKSYVQNGGSVIMTSGLLSALSKDELHQLGEIYCTDKIAKIDTFTYDTHMCAFANYSKSEGILIPQIEFSTNDMWQHVCAISGEKSYPILLSTTYGAGMIYFLTIPEDFTRLFDFPKDVLNYMRDFLLNNDRVKIHAPAKISLFTYDNDSFVIQSFLDYKTYVTIVIDEENAEISNIAAGERLSGVTIDGKTHIKTLIEPRTYMAYKIENV